MKKVLPAVILGALLSAPVTASAITFGGFNQEKKSGISGPVFNQKKPDREKPGLPAFEKNGKDLMKIVTKGKPKGDGRWPPMDIGNIGDHPSGKPGKREKHGGMAPVPLPAAAWLLIGGVGALGAASRRKRAKS